MFNRRVMLALSLALLAACSKGGGSSAGGSSLEAQADMTMGNPNAKVTMIEYHSVACPYCQMFATTVFPDFKAKYIDTGKVYYISREALTHDPGLAAFGFLVAHCAGKDKYFAVVDTLYRRQPELEAQGADVHGILLDIARSAGLTEAQFNTCVNDDAALETMQKRWDGYVKEGYSSTPTILINKKNVNPTAADLNAAVEEALK